MGNLQFSINSTLEPEKLMMYIIDFESYKNFFPDQIKGVKILDRHNDEIFTEEQHLILRIHRALAIRAHRHFFGLKIFGRS